jgi:mannose-6-phosphate isomerase-like protein (cupin superfamily)
MTDLFSPSITALPQADIPLPGVTAYLSQAADHQIVFMQFAADVTLPAHAHAAQSGFVLEGHIDMVIGGAARRFGKGDRYFIPAGVEHSATIHRGYADITFFAEAHRYQVK